MPGIPLGDALGPRTLAFDRLPARRCHDLYRSAEPLGQVISDGECCERGLRAVQPDHDPVRMPPLTPLWASEKHRACCVVQERAGRLTGHYAEEPAAAPTAERKKGGVVLVVDVSQDGFCIASHDLRRTVESAAHNLSRRGASTVSLLFELSRDVAHAETGMYRNTGIESSDGVHSSANRTERKRLMKRFEAEVGSVNTHHNPIEHTHDPIIVRP